jgi:hypothetical protein
MSVILTYLRFNVTKQSAAAKYYTISSPTACFHPARKGAPPARKGQQDEIWSSLQLSSGISANILDFGTPQKHVLKDGRR